MKHLQPRTGAQRAAPGSAGGRVQARPSCRTDRAWEATLEGEAGAHALRPAPSPSLLILTLSWELLTGCGGTPRESHGSPSEDAPAVSAPAPPKSPVVDTNPSDTKERSSPACDALVQCVRRALPRGFDPAQLSAQQEAITPCYGTTDEEKEAVGKCAPVTLGTDPRSHLEVQLRTTCSDICPTYQFAYFAYAGFGPKGRSERDCLCSNGWPVASPGWNGYVGCSPRKQGASEHPFVAFIETRRGRRADAYGEPRRELILHASATLEPALRLLGLGWGISILAIDGVDADSIRVGALGERYAGAPPTRLELLSNTRESLELRQVPQTHAFWTDASLALATHRDRIPTRCGDEPGWRVVSLLGPGGTKSVTYDPRCAQSEVFTSLAQKARALPRPSRCADTTRSAAELACSGAFANMRMVEVDAGDARIRVLEEPAVSFLCAVMRQASGEPVISR